MQTPSYYPQTRLPLLEDKSIYQRLELDQLFYIFYYMTGTYEQWLAAQELKRQSWRFHKQYLTWFQRAHNPQAITEDYEQGGYYYFDWENSWCQRRKSDFRFEVSVPGCAMTRADRTVPLAFRPLSVDVASSTDEIVAAAAEQPDVTSVRICRVEWAPCVNV